MKYNLTQWYPEGRILEAVNGCMKEIEKSGLSQYEALKVPECLINAIKRSNHISAKKEGFKYAELKVETIDGGYAFIGPDPVGD